MSHMSLYFYPHVASHLALCHMSNERNGHVALLILGVNGHSSRQNEPVSLVTFQT